MPVGFRVVSDGPGDAGTTTGVVFAADLLRADRAPGRLVDIDEMPDGLLLFCDDKDGLVCLFRDVGGAPG